MTQQSVEGSVGSVHARSCERVCVAFFSPLQCVRFLRLYLLGGLAGSGGKKRSFFGEAVSRVFVYVAVK